MSDEELKRRVHDLFDPQGKPSPRPNSATFDATYYMSDRMVCLSPEDDMRLEHIVAAHPDATIAVTVTWTEEAK